jgi:hypothetical protein
MPRMPATPLIGFVLVWGLAPIVARADPALDQITQTATQICGTVAQAGNSTSVEVKGGVNAKLSALLKHFADLGVEGTGTIAEESYVGVLQEQLADALKDERNCKEHVFDVLQQKLIPEVHKATIRGLKALYAEGEAVFERGMSLSVSANPDSDKQFFDNIAQWTGKVENWVSDTMGPAARARLIQYDGQQPLNFGKKDRDFNGMMFVLMQTKKNIGALIENPNWDVQ